MKKLSVFISTLFMLESLFAQLKPLDRDEAFHIYLKGTKTKLSESEELDYAKTFDDEIYMKYRKDEFEWDEKFSEIKKSMNNRINEAKLDSTYVINTEIEFGDYDFKNEGFPVSIGEGTFFPLERFYNRGLVNDYKSLLSKQMALKIDSFEKYNFFKMPKNEAKSFLQGRKSNTGNVDRKITLQITYKLASFDSKEFKEFKDLALYNDYIPIVGIIEKIEVYDTSNSRGLKKIGELINK